MDFDNYLKSKSSNYSLCKRTDVQERHDAEDRFAGGLAWNKFWNKGLLATAREFLTPQPGVAPFRMPVLSVPVRWQGESWDLLARQQTARSHLPGVGEALTHGRTLCAWSWNYLVGTDGITHANYEFVLLFWVLAKFFHFDCFACDKHGDKWW